MTKANNLYTLTTKEIYTISVRPTLENIYHKNDLFIFTMRNCKLKKN